jgi:hypothetical protein
MNTVVASVDLRACLVAIGFLTFVHCVRGEQAPVPVDELEKQSDLIVEADVLSVAKVGHPDAAGWCARLRIRKTFKGPNQESPMTYWFTPPETGVVGGRNESVFAGEHVKLYLVFERGRYVAWASNSVETLDHFPQERRVLPTEFSEVIYADATKSTARPVRRCRQ